MHEQKTNYFIQAAPESEKPRAANASLSPTPDTLAVHNSSVLVQPKYPGWLEKLDTITAWVGGISLVAVWIGGILAIVCTTFFDLNVLPYALTAFLAVATVGYLGAFIIQAYVITRIKRLLRRT